MKFGGRFWRVAAGVLVTLALAGCGSEEREQGTGLEGTWRTASISASEAEATLRRHGLERWVEPFRRVTPFADDISLVLDLHDGEWDLYGVPDGGAREEIDYDAEYVVRGDEVDKIHSTGVTTYRWAVEGDVLTFEWLRSTEPPYEGVPDEVFSRVLSMTSEFERQG